MFGRIRASTSSLDTLDGSPSKILKDDTFSIYEATLMKLKLGARRDTSEVTNDSSVNSPSAEEANLIMPDFNPATSTSYSETTVMDTESDNFSPRVTDHVSGGSSEQLKQSNVSILHFFKVKDTGYAGVSSSEEATTSKRNGSSESISSICVESDCRSDVECVQILQDCEMSD